MSELDRPGEAREIARRELLEVMREIRARLADPDANFLWSSWEDADDALAETDALIQELEDGGAPDRFTLSVLFAPTGPIQETAMSSGWGDEFLSLASRCDGALAILHGGG
ncbi:MAG TPA: hypothetical protein VHG93_17510 [Longimicrobium sp.]|nr:hypothetical protein [Longimicrobium sp.]